MEQTDYVDKITPHNEVDTNLPRLVLSDKSVCLTLNKLTN